MNDLEFFGKTQQLPWTIKYIPNIMLYTGHNKNHKPYRVYKCEICNRFISFKAVSIHQQNHTPIVFNRV